MNEKQTLFEQQALVITIFCAPLDCLMSNVLKTVPINLKLWKLPKSKTKKLRNENRTPLNMVWIRNLRYSHFNASHKKERIRNEIIGEKIRASKNIWKRVEINALETYLVHFRASIRLFDHTTSYWHNRFSMKQFIFSYHFFELTISLCIE